MGELKIDLGKPLLEVIGLKAMRCQVLEHETPKVMSLILSAA